MNDTRKEGTEGCREDGALRLRSEELEASRRATEGGSNAPSLLAGVVAGREAQQP